MKPQYLNLEKLFQILYLYSAYLISMSEYTQGSSHWVTISYHINYWMAQLELEFVLPDIPCLELKFSPLGTIWLIFHPQRA